MGVGYASNADGC